MQFTYYGHACFALTHQELSILVDPFISGNELASHIDISSLKPNYIFISHGHQDHILDCVTIAKQSNATVVCSWEIYEWLQKQGVSNIHPMNTGGKKHFDFGWVKCVVAQHSSGLPDGTYGGNPMGFIFNFGEKNIYYTGDTALTLDMQLIPKWAKIDYMIAPIGDNFTMGFEDASLAAEMVQCSEVIGVHYDTFGFIVIDKEKAKQHFNSNNQQLHLLAIGDTKTL